MFLLVDLIYTICALVFLTTLIDVGQKLLKLKNLLQKQNCL